MTDDFYENIAEYEIKQYQAECKTWKNNQLRDAIKKIHRNDPDMMMTDAEYDRRIREEKEKYDR